MHLEYSRDGWIVYCEPTAGISHLVKTGLDWTAEWEVKELRWRCLYIYWLCSHCKRLELQGRPCRNSSPVFNRGQHNLLTYCRDSNPPILAGNLLFLLNIIRVLETLPFLCLMSLFSTLCRFSATGFSAIFTLLSSDHEPEIILGAVFPLTVISKSRKWHLEGTYLQIFPWRACCRFP